MKTLVFATRNRHKIKELQEMIRPLGLEAVSLDDIAPDAPEVEETGSTFLENAFLKARSAFEATGLPSVADDSGICVDHLGGAPGIHSARWAGDDEANNDRLLAVLEGVPDPERGAHYHCALALVCPPGFLPDGRTEADTTGTFGGRIGHERQGTGGFGYDPLFVLDDLGCTVAQLSADQKHEISHRGNAFRELVALLPAEPDPG